MKTIQKILLGIVLVGIGCLAGTKVVKAETVEFNYTDGSDLEYSITGGTSGASYTIMADGVTTPLASGNLNDSGATQAGTKVNSGDLLDALNDIDRTTKYTVYAKIGDTRIDTPTQDVTVYLLKLDFDPNKLTCSLKTSTLTPALTDTTYDVTFTVNDYPYYISSYTEKDPLTDGAGTTTSVDGKITLTKSLSASKSYSIETDSQTATVTGFDDIDNTQKRADITWKASVGQGSDYYYYYLANVTETLIPEVEFDVPKATALPKTAIIKNTKTGSGKGTLSVYISKTQLSEPVTAEKIAGCHLLTTSDPNSPYIFQTIRAVGISGSDEIVKGYPYPYTATAYLDTAMTVPAIGDPVFTWTKSGAASTINPATPSKDPINLTANATTGTVSLQAATAGVSSAVKSITILDNTGISIVFPNAGRITKGFSLDCSKEKLSFIPDAVKSAVTKVELKESNSSIGTFDANGKFQALSVGTTGYTAKIHLGGSIVNISSSGGLTVLPKAEIENDYSKSSKKLEFKLPVAVFTNNSDEYNIPDVNKYQIAVFDKDGNELIDAVEFSGTPNKTLELSASELKEKIVDKLNEKGKLSGDSKKITLRIRPGGKSQTQTSKTVYNNNDNVVATTELTVYRVSVAEKNNIKSSYEYGLAGQEVKITAAPKSGYKFVSWEDDSSAGQTRTVTIQEDTSKNTYTATANVAGASTPKDSGSAASGNAGGKLDKVPKTGEGNARMLIIMIAMISATIAGAILLSYMPARANANKGIAGAEDVKGFFDSTPTTNAKDTNTEQTAANTADKEDDKS